MVPCMCIIRYRLGHGLLCVVRPCELHHESPGCCCSGATLERYNGYVIGGYAVATLWLWMTAARLLRQPGERLCYGYRASQERINTFAVSTAPSHLLPCPTWVQQIVRTVWTARQVASQTGSVIQLPLKLEWDAAASRADCKQFTKLLPGPDDVRDPNLLFP